MVIELKENNVGLLDMFCWRNALDILVLLCENKGKISVDNLCFKMTLEKVDVFERLDFLKSKGIPLIYYESTNLIQWETEDLRNEIESLKNALISSEAKLEDMNKEEFDGY